LALLAQIRTRAVRSSRGGLSLGIGDDCALLAPRPGEELAVTTDLSIAGRHFRLDWHQPESVGHRALARGLSDLAAMGARPVAAFLSLGLPRELTVASGRRLAWVQRFLNGLLALADEHSTPLAGGDLAESPLAVADIVLVGAVPRGRALLRSGARPGDSLYVTGSLGGAAAALARLAQLAAQAAGQLSVKGTGFSPYIETPGDAGALQAAEKLPVRAKNLDPGHEVSGHDFSRAASAAGSTGALAPECRSSSDPPAAPPRIPKRLAAQLAPHLYPQPRIAQGLRLQRRGLASAALDLSDGLSTDLAHLCEESGVAAAVDAALLPLHPGATLGQALHGGEDYELLFTAPPAARLPRQIGGVKITRIGRILKATRNQPAITLLTEQGPQPLKPDGWEHFS
jgi:thiamine-monophosphate kinase